MNYFKSNLKYLLKRLRVSQEQLALYANVRSTTISNYVNGISSPGIEELVKICQFFGISIDYLIFENFEEGKVITEEDVVNFKEKGKVIGKLIGKVIHEKSMVLDPKNGKSGMPENPDDILLWAVLQTVRQIDSKLDGVKGSVDELNKKKG